MSDDENEVNIEKYLKSQIYYFSHFQQLRCNIADLCYIYNLYGTNVGEAMSKFVLIQFLAWPTPYFLMYIY